MSFMPEAECFATLCASCGTYGDRPHNTNCETIAATIKAPAVSAEFMAAWESVCGLK